MSRTKVPEWFPFALIASGLIAVGAGIRSGFKTAADIPPPPPPTPPSPPPLSRAGVLRDWFEGDYRI